MCQSLTGRKEKRAVMQKQGGKQMDENDVRVIKIGKDALFEFIYEEMIANQDSFFDVDCESVVSQ